MLRHDGYDPETAQIANAVPARNNRQRLADRLLDLFGELHDAIEIPEGGLLILDNRRMIHGRTAFADPDRHLIRYWLR